MIKVEDIDAAVDAVKRSSPPEANVEVHDYYSELLENVLDSCISESIHLDHPEVVKRISHLQKVTDRNQKHDHLCRFGRILTLGDLRAITNGLPDEMPLICTGDTGNRQGLEFYSNEWVFQKAPGAQIDLGRAVYAARIYGIPEIDWNGTRQVAIDPKLIS